MTTDTTLATVPRGKNGPVQITAGDDPPDPVAAARAKVAELLQTELEWSALLEQRKAELAKLEATDGGEVLDAGSLDVVADAAVRMVTIRAELDTIDRTIAVARERRVAAVKHVFEHEAGALWAQSAVKRAEAAAHRVRTDELLAELEAHEGVPYGPVQPDRPALGSPVDGLVGGSLTIITRRASRTEARLMEAEDLERRARSERSVTQHGRVEAGSVDELIAEATADPMHIGPTIASMRAWAAQGLAKLEADIAAGHRSQFAMEARARGEGQPIRFELYWGAGVIDQASSRVYPVPQEPIEVESRGGLRRTWDRTTR